MKRRAASLSGVWPPSVAQRGAAISAIRGLLLGAVVVLACLAGCSPEGGDAGARYAVIVDALSADARRAGRERFEASCARCHGVKGVGTDAGPPLAHKTYAPGHHSDVAFTRAVAQGVRAHHWEFGNMPKLDGVSPDDVEKITAYVRWLQREAGLF